ncbi:hypothetical protein L7F22_033929 [Adiantum nelumboides]|nr:hypothetical protein [Adiantum nelumboides]
MAAYMSLSSAQYVSIKVTLEALRSCSGQYCPSTSLGFQRCTQPLSHTHLHPVACSAGKKDRVESARKLQTTATDLLAQLMKAENMEEFAREHVESLDQEFFMIASTYLSMAKKEGNAEVVSRIETTLKTAMREREKTLRPEIQLLNQLLRDKTSAERSKTMDKFLDYLNSDSYFFQLLNRMTLDVEKQPTVRSDPEQMNLLAQLRAINKEAREISRSLKHAGKE